MPLSFNLCFISMLNQNENFTLLSWIQNLISNTLLNQCISLCLNKIGNITKAMIFLTFKVIYHAHIVKTDSSSKYWNDCKDQI